MAVAARQIAETARVSHHAFSRHTAQVHVRKSKVEDGGTYKYGRTASDIQGGLQTLIHKSDQLKADVKVLLTPHSTCGRAATQLHSLRAAGGPRGAADTHIALA
jgi:hypothetical protein